MVVRAGLGLQRILKHEYSDIYVAGSGVTDPASTVMKLCNPALSKYMLYEVLQRLRQQFKSYIDGQNPFNHELQSKQSTLQWWAMLESNKFADVLAVSLHSILIR